MEGAARRQPGRGAAAPLPPDGRRAPSPPAFKALSLRGGGGVRSVGPGARAAGPALSPRCLTGRLWQPRLVGEKQQLRRRLLLRHGTR